MKSYLIFFLLLFTCACNQVEKKENKLVNAEGHDTVVIDYPQEIKNKHLESFYDQAKWVMYCIHCDERCRFYKRINITDTPFLGALDLRFDKVKFFTDTTELNFYFYYRDSLKCDVNTFYNYGTLTYGAAFKGNKDSIIYFLSETTITRFSKKGKTSRYDNPLQPEVIAFIKNNKDKLNPWFRKEAIRRKIIE
jgi:hypothetical protein